MTYTQLLPQIAKETKYEKALGINSEIRVFYDRKLKFNYLNSKQIKN